MPRRHDLSQKHQMIARLPHLAALTFKLRERPIEQRDLADAEPPRHSAESVQPPRRKTHGQFLLLHTQHIDPKIIRGREVWQDIRPPVDADQHHWRLSRNTRERVRRKSMGRSIRRHRRGNRNPGGEPGTGPAEGEGINYA